ncbi:MAG: hypothetical protein HC849_10945 [Oscillatoriales cyanobacterium RU_3_3]|nr:hypothetical protein [Oscillatoriales cyanobacterium RU_3_3]NJR21316.1 hypothetical protein [Richelia sp. CSU_2_1]
MTLAKEQITDSSSNSGLSNFRITVERLLELLDLEEEDEYGVLKPTEYAFRTAMKLVVEAYDVLRDNFPKASAATDDRGSITLDWTRLEPDRTVRLFCPFSQEQPVDIFHHTKDEYAVEDIISSPTLVYWLQWFNEI